MERCRTARRWQLFTASNAALAKRDTIFPAMSALTPPLSDLRQAGEPDLSGVDLSDKDLSGTHLEHARGLTARQLRGADLTNAHLPEELKKFEALKGVESASKAAGRIWATSVLACLYCWLTIAGTTDAQFFGAEQQAALPFIQMKMSMIGFYVAAPLILLVVFLYLQFSLQVLWEVYATLPAIFPDGRKLHERASPFFLSSIVRAQFSRLGARAGLAKWQARLAWLLGWWLVPLTLCWIWERSLVARLWWITAPQIAAIAIGIAAALFFGRIARDTLHGDSGRIWRSRREWLRESRSKWEILAGVVMAASFGFLSVYAYAGPFPAAELQYARIAVVSSGTEESASIAEQAGRGIDLTGRNLRYANAVGAELSNANFTHADLAHAQLWIADLRDAHFERSRLDGASLGSADLRGALFAFTDLRNVTWIGANLEGVSFFGDILDPLALKQMQLVARNWVLAFYSPESAKQLALPGDHSTRLGLKNLSGYDFARLEAVNMQAANLAGWNLQRANFSAVELDDANLSKSDLRGAVFGSARVTNTNFGGADLRGADLSAAVGLTQWQVNSAITDQTTKLPPGLVLSTGAACAAVSNGPKLPLRTR